MKNVTEKYISLFESIVDQIYDKDISGLKAFKTDGERLFDLLQLLRQGKVRIMESRENI